jgi:hypothetical protein
VSSSLWNGGFKDQFLEEIAKIKVGPPQDLSNFMGPVMYVLFYAAPLIAVLTSRTLAAEQHTTKF